METARRTRYFLAENAKSARLYLKEAGHPGPISALSITEIGHEPDASMIRSWLQPVLAGEDACIVSESGCPGVADPGATLVAAAKRLGIRVVPMTGPCSIILTLMASGLNGQRFRFLGYLPIDEAQRTKAIQDLERQSRTPETQLFIASSPPCLRFSPGPALIPGKESKRGRGSRERRICQAAELLRPAQSQAAISAVRH